MRGMFIHEFTMMREGKQMYHAKQKQESVWEQRKENTCKQILMPQHHTLYYSSRPFTIIHPLSRSRNEEACRCGYSFCMKLNRVSSSLISHLDILSCNVCASGGQEEIQRRFSAFNLLLCLVDTCILFEEWLFCQVCLFIHSSFAFFLLVLRKIHL